MRTIRHTVGQRRPEHKDSLCVLAHWSSRTILSLSSRAPFAEICIDRWISLTPRSPQSGRSTRLVHHSPRPPCISPPELEIVEMNPPQCGNGCGPVGEFVWLGRLCVWGNLVDARRDFYRNCSTRWHFCHEFEYTRGKNATSAKWPNLSTYRKQNGGHSNPAGDKMSSRRELPGALQKLKL